MKKMTDPDAPAPQPHASAAPSEASGLSVAHETAPPPLTSRVTTYPLSFTGSAGEYFRIWIVNVALSVVTLGFYTPWARVRTRQYFYGHTWLDGHNFEYTANPWALLRGYLIVAAFGVVYALSTNFPYKGSEWVVGALAVLFVVAYPWLVRQSMRFLARSTVHRGLNFRFTGSTGGSYLAYGLANIAGLLSSGLALPWAWFMQRRYQVSGVAYGSAQGHFRGSAGPFYLIALTGIGLALGGSLVLGILGVVGIGLARLGDAAFSASDLGAGAIAGIGAAYLGILALYGLAQQYVRSATMKYVLSNVELGGVVRVDATFSPWRLSWITLSNHAAQVVSLGLLTPWAAVRRSKYMLSHMQVRTITNLDDFTAVSTPQEAAIGEAATELLDINIGF